MEKKIDFIVAGVGFGDIERLIHDILKNNNNLNFLGYVDDYKSKENFKIIGKWNCLKKKNKSIKLFNAVAKNPIIRLAAQKKLDKYKLSYLNLIHPNISVLKTKIGKGNAIFDNVFISRNIKIGNHNIICPFVSIGHDVSIGSNCFFAPGAKILGGVKIMNNCYIGANSTIYQNVKLKNNTTIAANSFMIKNADKTGTYLGVPAKFINND